MLEMLVVLGLIGVLLGILLPSLGLVKESARRARTRDMAYQIVTAWTVYLNENRAFPSNSITQMDVATLTILNQGKSRLDVRKQEIDPNPAKGGLRDSWGGVFQVALDNGKGYDAGNPAYNGQVTTPYGVVRKSVAVWSKGRDGQELTRDDVKSWK